MSNAGFFLKNDFNADIRYATWMRNVYTTQNVQSNLKCVQDKVASGTASDCIFAEELIPYVQTPMFIRNSKQDKFQIE